MSDELYEELLALGKELAGVKICHLNSTAAGGGVAELLACYVPMLQAPGIQADWRLIHGEPEFFAITKSFHNALQGGHYDLRKPEQELYLRVNERSAKALGNDYDVYIVPDRSRLRSGISPGRATPCGSGDVISTAQLRTRMSACSCDR